jgi:hypothetical protein
MLTTKGITGTDSSSISSYLNMGINKMKINSIDTRVSSKGSYQVVFNVEGEPVSDSNFKGVDGAVGPVARITTSYLGNDSQVEEFVKNLAILASKLNVKEQLDTITATDIKDLVEKASSILTGKYFYGRVTGEEYVKTMGGIGISLHFSRYGAFASVEEGSDKLKPVDKTNPYDYKKVETINSSSTIIGDNSSVMY